MGVMNSSKGVLQIDDLWYDIPNGRKFNIIQNQLGQKLYSLEWNNGTSFYYTLDSDKVCSSKQEAVGILRSNWLEGANYLGQQYKDGFLCNVWEKAEIVWYYEDVITKIPVYWYFHTGIDGCCGDFCDFQSGGFTMGMGGYGGVAMGTGGIVFVVGVGATVVMGLSVCSNSGSNCDGVVATGVSFVTKY